MILLITAAGYANETRYKVDRKRPISSADRRRLMSDVLDVLDARDVWYGVGGAPFIAAKLKDHKLRIQALQEHHEGVRVPDRSVPLPM